MTGKNVPKTGHKCCYESEEYANDEKVQKVKKARERTKENTYCYRACSRGEINTAGLNVDKFWDWYREMDPSGERSDDEIQLMYGIFYGVRGDVRKATEAFQASQSTSFVFCKEILGRENYMKYSKATKRT